MVIDACVFHEWKGTDTLTPYMPEGGEMRSHEPATFAGR